MTDGFIRKKVESLTLGEKLRKLRQQYRMSYAEIAKATRIQAKYLEYLENGEYEKLPAEVYVRGFLKSYARHLGLDDDAFLKLYDKEKHIRVHLGHEKSVKESVRYPAMNAWIITPRTLLFTLLALIVGGTLFYLFSEFRSFVAEPRLLIIDPLSGATIDGSIVVLRGQTDPGAIVVANGEPVFVGGQGEFSEELTLQQGLNRIVIRATNRFNNTKEEVLAVESRVDPESSQGTEGAPAQGFLFAIRAIERTVDVTVSNGDRVLYSGTLVPGKEERFTELSGTVRVTTSDALHTEVRLGDGAAERVGTEGVPLNGKTYEPPAPTVSETGETNP